MADNTESALGLLFGPTLEQLRMQRQNKLDAAAAAYGNQSPFARASSGMFRAGGQIADIGSGMLGLENPEVTAAKQREAQLSGINFQDPNSILERASQISDPRLKLQLQALAQQRQIEASKLNLEAARTSKEQMLTDEAPKLRHEEKIAEIAQRAEAARLRSEDSRLNAEQRVAASREANAMRLEIAKLIAASKSQAQEVKQTETLKKREEGRETVDSLVGTLRDYYNQLQDMGGITDPQKGTINNIVAGISSSGVGQAVGRLTGTKAQSKRNSIIQQRPLLLQAIKEATGMSAKQMDSNVELKMYLAASTDPALDIAANLSALDKIAELYGLGNVRDKPTATPSPTGVDPKVWNVMTPEERKLWQ